MSEDDFWRIIEESRSGFWNSFRGVTQDAQEATLKKLLSKLSVQDIISFDRIFTELLYKSYTWELWGAAYVMHGGCSDDSFDYFRNGLIASGREKFERALKDVESLADWAQPDMRFEGFRYVSFAVHRQKTGGDKMPPHGLKFPGTPTGAEWREDSDDLKKRFPKLWAKFGS
jgi:hypothetical protein